MEVVVFYLILAGGLAVICVTDSPARAGGAESRTVLYQVTYADRRIVNLTTPPTTDRGILLVTRITSTNSALPGYETVSTGNTPIEELNPQRTVEQQLSWNGSAWVAEGDQNAQKPTMPLQGSQGRTAVRVQNVLHWVTESGNQLKTAQARLETAKKQDDIILALRDIERASQALKLATLAVGELQTTLLKGGISTGSMPPPTADQVLPDNAVDTLATSPDGYPPNQPVLKSHVNVSGYVGGLGTWGGWSPRGRDAWPIAGDVDVYQETPNPDYDTGPRVIIREQK